MSEPWAPVGGEPFCWQPKAALRLIRESLDGENTVASALTVYGVMTEVASDKQSCEFQTTYGFLAMRTGLSPRIIHARVKDLVAIGLLRFNVPKVKAPGTFRLLHPERQPLQDDKQPLQDDVQRSKKTSLHGSEESPEESCKKSPEDRAPTPRFQKPTIEVIKAEASRIGLAETEAIKFHSYHESSGWRVGRNPLKSWQAALVTWKLRCDDKPSKQSNLTKTVPHFTTGETEL